jgi:hypothetical protein
LREQQIEIEAVLLEDAGLLAELGYRSIPAPALTDGDLQRVVRPGGER